MNASTVEAKTRPEDLLPKEELDKSIARLSENKDRWAQLPVDDRIELLEQIKHCSMEVAEDWVETATRQKQIPSGSPLSGEEWISGPYGTGSSRSAWFHIRSGITCC